MRVQVGQKRLGLALGSGGLRGAAHIGVLQALQQYGIVPEALSGSSAGAVVAALYAVGYTADDMEQAILRLRPTDLSELPSGQVAGSGPIARWRARRSATLRLPLGLLSGRALERVLGMLLGERLVADVRVPLAILAADVNSGAEVIFSNVAEVGSAAVCDATLVKAARASSSIPGVFVPLQIGEYLLVDGAVKAAVPVELVRALGADVVVGVDLGYAARAPKHAGNLIDVISQSFDILSSQLTDRQLADAVDLVISPPVPHIGLGNLQDLPQAIRLGREAMEAAMPQLLDLLK
jgi:NTE family protein